MSEYLPIPVATLRPNVCLGFDVFVHISDKHILYIHGDDSIEAERLDHLAGKRVRHLFIRAADKKAYDDFVSQSKISALGDPKMPLAVKAEIVNGQSKAAVEKFFENPGAKENFTATEDAARDQVTLLMKYPASLVEMLKAAEKDNTTYQHSVNVSNLSICLATHLGAAKEVCEVVGAGALMHDIGRGDSSEGDMTPEKYSQHPRLGAQMLKGRPYVTKDILDIIVLHEERLDGKGYPAGLKKLDQLFQIVGLTNLYDKYVTLMGREPKDAYDEIASMDPPPYQKELILGLKEILAKHKIL